MIIFQSTKRKIHERSSLRQKNKSLYYSFWFPFFCISTVKNFSLIEESISIGDSANTCLCRFRSEFPLRIPQEFPLRIPSGISNVYSVENFLMRFQRILPRGVLPRIPSGDSAKKSPWSFRLKFRVEIPPGIPSRSTLEIPPGVPS